MSIVHQMRSRLSAGGREALPAAIELIVYLTGIVAMVAWLPPYSGLGILARAGTLAGTVAVTLLWAVRLPWLTLAACFGLGVFGLATGGSGDLFFLLPCWAAWRATQARRAPSAWEFTALAAAAAAGVATAQHLVQNMSGALLWPAMTLTTITLSCGLVAAAPRRSAERERELTAALNRQRAELRREFHDVMAHSLGTISMQAGVARLTSRTPEGMRAVLSDIEANSRASLAEMHAVLAATRPSVGLDLETIVLRARQAGINIEARVDDGGELPPRVQDALRRVAQEAITNVVRHAPGSLCAVLLTVSERETRLLVTDDGPGSDVAEPGNGLLGIMERVEDLHGKVRFGRNTGPGFRLEAVIPSLSA